MDYLDTEQNKSAHFSFALPFQFAAQRRACLTARQGFLQSRVSAADADFTLSEQEVSILGEILSFARTFFEKNSRTDLGVATSNDSNGPPV